MITSSYQSVNKTVVQAQPNLRRVLTAATVNGTSMFLLSYLLVYFTCQVASLAMAHHQGIAAVLHYNQLEFVMKGRLWQSDTVVLVYGIAPVAALTLAGICQIWSWTLQRTPGNWKQFCFWGMLHGLNLGLGALITGFFTHSGAWYALHWFPLAPKTIFILSLSASLVLIGIGLLLPYIFLQCCDSITLMQAPNRQGMLWSMLLGPWLLGSVLLVLFKFPVSDYELFLCLSLAFLVVPVYLRSRAMLINEGFLNPRRSRIAWGVVVLNIITTLLLRLCLNKGFIIN